MAQKTWEMANSVETISGIDEIYRYDKKQQQDILTAKPWEKEYVLENSLVHVQNLMYFDNSIRLFLLMNIFCIVVPTAFNLFCEHYGITHVSTGEVICFMYDYDVYMHNFCNIMFKGV